MARKKSAPPISFLAQVLATISWSAEQTITRNSKSYRVKMGAPTPAFWELWKTSKDDIKALDISCWKSETTGRWQVQQMLGRANITTKVDQKAIQESYAETADIEVPVPQGLTLYPFQKAAIAYALKRPGVLFGDAPGLGKSLEAIGTVNTLPDAISVLVICPASVKINWSREWAKWDIKNLSIGIANGPTLPETNVVILNYDVLKKYKEQIQARNWDVLIGDEIHYCSNYKAIRTKMVFGSYKDQIPPIQATKKLFLSGTPISNKITHLWPIVKALDPKGLGLDWEYFMTRYAGGVKINGMWGFDLPPSNLEELQARLRSSIMVRRTKEQVLPELPPKLRKVVEIEVVGRKLKKLIKDETKAAEAIYGTWEQCQENLRDLEEAEKPKLDTISSLRKEVALAKVPAVIEHLEDALEQEDKIICFAHHKEVITLLLDHFKDVAVKVDGSMNPSSRQVSIDRFMTDPACRLFIGSMTACGEGITLTSSSHVVFAELDWLPKTILQCEDRSNRIGQKDSVFIEYIVWDGSLDARMAHHYVDKTNTNTRALDKL